MSDAAYGDEHMKFLPADMRKREEEQRAEKQRAEAERLSRTALGFEVELTISGEDLNEMLRACVRQMLEKHNVIKSFGPIVADMRLQINERGAYVDVKYPIRFSNKKT